MYYIEENVFKNKRPTRIVSGATKNITGHWRTHCAQFKIRAYNLILTPGYVHSTCDCMMCDILIDNFGPFMGFTEDLLRLKSNLNSTSLTFSELFIDLKLKGQKIISCPDLMFLTDEDDQIPDRKDWQELSKIFKIHSISIDVGPKRIHEFSCEDIGLTCENFESAPKDSDKSGIRNSRVLVFGSGSA